MDYHVIMKAKIDLSQAGLADKPFRSSFSSGNFSENSADQAYIIGGNMSRGRALGGMERLFHQQNSVGSSNLTSILFFEGSLDESSIPEALKRVQASFPLLTAQIVSDPKLRFEEAHGDIPFQILKRLDAEHWRLQVRQEVRRKWKNERMFVTFLIGEGRGEIILAADHTVADAKSMYAVCQFLIRALNGQVTPLVPALDAWEKRLPKPFRGIRGFFNMIRFVWNLFRHSPEKSLRFGKDSSNINTVSHGFQMDKLTLALLKRACDQNRSNLNSIFCAASVLAAFELYSEEKSGDVCLNVPVSVRDQIVPPASAEELGMFISAFLQWHKIDATTDIWELSRRILERTRSGVKAGESIRLGQIAKGPEREELPRPDKNRQRFEHSITVSNPGKLPSFEDLPNAKIVGYRNLGSLWTRESIVIVVLGYGDNLFVDAEISWERLGHVPDSAERLANGIRHKVLSLLENT